MGKHFATIPDNLKNFIAVQKIFFVATAGDEGRVNLSPKGMDSLRVIGSSRIVWLNLTGSGNETAAHVRENGRMTLMWCAFDGPPMILRIYGSARVVHTRDTEWNELIGHLNPLPGARQIFDLTVDLVQTSCGFAVPRYDYGGDRDQLIKWAHTKGEDGIHRYWEDNNQTSLDGNPTHILKETD
ncbi:MAG: pyridoxamine 5'-phosphate oxidase family protein [Candidatus Omnitrophica bacterium]|nr:pyridoxamine 5'-phosphate oxidase family protein [Candidatus Omnitrophota bacterium]MCB9720321.1 pyridoxamine 5'-phosphate oxidase family protein [Candidatus Omnitrophota bacterium]